MKELKPRIHENGIDYILVGDYYVPDKSRLSIRLQPPMSEERRRKASENAKQTGFRSRTE